MSRYRARQFAYAFALSAAGLVVAARILVRAFDEITTLPPKRSR